MRLNVGVIVAHMKAEIMKIPVAEMRQTVNMAKLIYFVSLKSLHEKLKDCLLENPS